MSKPVFEDLFTFSKRRNRKSYFLYALALIGLSALLAIMFWITVAINSEIGIWVVGIISVLISVPTAISTWAVSAQRCRDFGWTGWAVLLTIIPYVGIVFAIAIMCIPGSVGDNRYGPDPIAEG